MIRLAFHVLRRVYNEGEKKKKRKKWRKKKKKKRVEGKRSRKKDTKYVGNRNSFSLKTSTSFFHHKCY